MTGAGGLRTDPLQTQQLIRLALLDYLKEDRQVEERTAACDALKTIFAGLDQEITWHRELAERRDQEIWDRDRAVEEKDRTIRRMDVELIRLGGLLATAEEATAASQLTRGEEPCGK